MTLGIIRSSVSRLAVVALLLTADSGAQLQSPPPVVRGGHDQRQSTGAVTLRGKSVAVAGLAANTAMKLGNYTCTDVVGEPAGTCGLVTDYSRIVYDPNRQRMVIFGGGHSSTSYDAINTYDLVNLKWVEEYLPGNCASHVASNLNATNGTWITGPAGGPYPRPLARHTEDEMVVVGDELIVLESVEGNGNYCANLPNYTGYEFATAGKIAHYNFVTKTWSYSSVNGIQSDWPGAAYDPVSGQVIILGQQGLDLYDPVAKTKTRVIDFGTYAGLAQLKDDQGNAIANTLTYNNNLVYYPPNQKFYYFERTGQAVYELSLNRSNFAQSTIVRQTTSGTPPPAGVETGFGYDSTNQIIGGGPLQNVFYAYAPAAKAWTAKTVQGGTPGSVAFHALDYDAKDNVFVFITDATSGRQTWAYRYGP